MSQNQNSSVSNFATSRSNGQQLRPSLPGLSMALLALVSACEALGQTKVPPSPDKSWEPPKYREYQRELDQVFRDASREHYRGIIDPEKVCDLADLIDIAQRVHPETRVAWERARQAASDVGLAQSAYYPWLVASAGAGYEKMFMPFPQLQTGPAPNEVSITGGGTLAMYTVGEQAALNLKWLLFDFGGRKATVNAAKEGLMVANVTFNATHQKIVFDVTRRFYELDAARQKFALAQSSLLAAQTVADATRMRQTNGLATTPEVLQAEQLTANASFQLTAARGELNDAQVALVDSVGVLPTTPLRVANAPDQPVTDTVDESLEILIDRALLQRPDLIAKLSLVRARRADVAKAKSEYYPKISAGANVGYSALDVSVPNTPYFGGGEPVYGAGLAIELPLFDGFSRRKKLQGAESALRTAESELMASRDAVVREVWKAHTDFKTALHKQESAAALLSAAQSAFEASLESYRRGLGTYVEMVNAQQNLTAAKTVSADTRSAINISKTALALSMGALAKPSNSSAPHHP